MLDRIDLASPPLASDRLSGDPAAAYSPQGLADRGALTSVAVERTRMPMAVTDPRQPDNPIVLANQAFLQLTGLTADEVVGRNCRFLQGPDTDPSAVAEIRSALAEEREITVELLNYRGDGSTFWNQLFVSPVHDEDGRLLYFFASMLDVTQRRIARDLELAEHRLLLEVDHRAKNVLALVQGIVRLSRADDARRYARSVQGRVDALARAHALLAERRWLDVPLERVIRDAAEPFGRLRVTCEGPELTLNAPQVQPLALLLHEMLDNARQHGALSTPDGKVAVHWGRPEDRCLLVEWREAGGPPPAEERQRGFGTTMIDAILARQLGGRARFDWAADGLVATLEIPVPPTEA